MKRTIRAQTATDCGCPEDNRGTRTEEGLQADFHLTREGLYIYYVS